MGVTAPVRALIPALLLGAAGVLGGCAFEPALPPVPEHLVDVATVPGFESIRQWGDGTALSAQDPGNSAAPSGTTSAGAQEGLNVLAISGGAANGGFAAGLITGWTETGRRPTFHVVTGVSVGALEAPFAFLGPDHDETLRALFARLSGSDLLRRKPGFIAYLGDSLASAQPLAALIEDFVDATLVEAIAAEHRKGRRLFVGTTHVYAGRPVIWDIGAIAASDRPDALDLVRKVLLASAAAPVVLPPVYFDVVAGDRGYHEMHVDGGITRAAFVGPPGIDWQALARAAGTGQGIRFYVIRNGRALGEYMIMEPRVPALGRHAMLELSRSLGVGDLYRIHARAQSEGAEYHAAWIGSDFDAPWEDLDDPRYMQALFDYGYALGSSGRAWHARPPGLNAE